MNYFEFAHWAPLPNIYVLWKTKQKIRNSGIKIDILKICMCQNYISYTHFDFPIKAVLVLKRDPRLVSAIWRIWASVNFNNVFVSVVLFIKSYKKHFLSLTKSDKWHWLQLTNIFYIFQCNKCQILNNLDKISYTISPGTQLLIKSLMFRFYVCYSITNPSPETLWRYKAVLSFSKQARIWAEHFTINKRPSFTECKFRPCLDITKYLLSNLLSNNIIFETLDGDLPRIGPIGPESLRSQGMGLRIWWSDGWLSLLFFSINTISQHKLINQRTA